MVFKKNNPGCACCHDDCKIEVIGWNHIAGTWLNDGNYLETVHTNGLSITLNEHPDGKYSHYVKVKVRGEDDGDILRVVVASDMAGENYL